MQPSGATLLFLAAGLFVAGALALLGLSRLAAPRAHGAWTKFAVQVALTAWVLVPAWLGEGWFAASVTLTTLAGAPELHRTLSRGANARSAVVLRGVGLLALGACALALVQTRALGFWHVVFLYGAVELNDSLAFLVGRFAGRRRIFPRLSPNKTLAGLLAGLGGATASGALFAFAEPAWSGWQCTALGLGLGIAGTSADLFASGIKRRAGVKDFSNLLPGHGGVLDAYDSLLLVAPLWYALLLGPLRSG